MDAVAQFFGMGGYAAFVWPSFAITVGVLAVLLIASARFLRASEETLKALEGSRQGRRAEEEAGETQA